MAGHDGRRSSASLACAKATRTGADMADQWVRLGMAIVIIALISIGLYQFSGRAAAVEKPYRRPQPQAINAPAPGYRPRARLLRSMTGQQRSARRGPQRGSTSTSRNTGVCWPRMGRRDPPADDPAPAGRGRSQARQFTAAKALAATLKPSRHPEKSIRRFWLALAIPANGSDARPAVPWSARSSSHSGCAGREIPMRAGHHCR